jgi:hypothetical protein
MVAAQDPEVARYPLTLLLSIMLRNESRPTRYRTKHTHLLVDGVPSFHRRAVSKLQSSSDVT